MHCEITNKTTNAKQNTMQKATMKEFWSSIDTTEKSKLRVAVAEQCGKSIDTVLAWILGYREPSKLEKEALLEYIRKTHKVEIIVE